MIVVIVKPIPQDTEWNRSFNVLVPLNIQGKTGELMREAQSPNMQHGSIGAEIKIEDQVHSLPVWAFERVKIIRTTNLSFQI